MHILIEFLLYKGKKMKDNWNVKDVNIDKEKEYNILFLDIDGVLNMYGSSNRSFKSIDPIESFLVERLNYIVNYFQERDDLNDIKIVISSAWRNNMTKVISKLTLAGFKYPGCIIDFTIFPIKLDEPKEPPFKHSHEKRGEQIKLWLKETDIKVKNYVVVDDETYDINHDFIKPIPFNKTILINGYEGLSNADALQIIFMFEFPDLYNIVHKLSKTNFSYVDTIQESLLRQILEFVNIHSFRNQFWYSYEYVFEKYFFNHVNYVYFLNLKNLKILIKEINDDIQHFINNEKTEYQTTKYTKLDLKNYKEFMLDKEDYCLHKVRQKFRRKYLELYFDKYVIK